MSKIKSVIVVTALATSFITTGFASTILENTDTVKKISIHMGLDDTAPIELEAGWGAPEITHRWTVDKYPSLAIPVLDVDKRLSKITFNMTACADIVSKQRLEICLDNFNTVLHEGIYTNMNPFQVSLPHPADYTEEYAMYMFCMPDLCKPGWIDPSNKDSRTLGFLFTDIELEYTKKQEIL